MYFCTIDFMIGCGIQNSLHLCIIHSTKDLKRTNLLRKMNFTNISSSSWQLNVSKADNATLERRSSERIPAFVFCVSLAIIGIVGNSHAIYIYVQRFRQQMKKRHTLTNPYLVFTLSLATLDLFSCLVVLPLDNVYMGMVFTPLSENMCKFSIYIQYVTHISGVIHIVLISIYCWRLVCYPLKSQIDYKLAIKMVFACDIVSFIVGLPLIFLAGTNTTIIDGREGPKCYVDKTKDSLLIRITFGLLFCGFAVCIIIICSSYVALIVSIRRKAIKRSASTRIREIRNNNDKTTATLIILTALFIIAYIPYMVLAVLNVFKKDFKRNMSWTGYAANKLFVRFQLINNVVNPFVYGLRDKEFRLSIRKMYTCLERKTEATRSQTMPVELT